MSLVGFDLSYHGPRFAGWHRQRDGDASVQATLERAVSAALGPVAAAGAVRLNALTDVASAKGAHSRGQLCFFRATPEALALVASGDVRPVLPAGDPQQPPPAIAGPLRALGAAWPRPSRLRVRYYFLQGQPAPELAPFAWYAKEPLDVAALRRAAGLLVGSHDLSALSRSKKNGGGGGGGGDAALTRIEWVRVAQLPASASAFDLVRCSGDGTTALDTGGGATGASWLLQLEIATVEGSGTLPRQLVQRLAALLRRLASSEAEEAERRMRAVLDGSSSEARELAVAPARGLWLEAVGLQGGAAATSEESGSVAEPPAKRAHWEAGGAGGGSGDEGSRVPVHTMSSRALLAGACWVGPSNLGSQRLRSSDYTELLQLQGGSEDGQPVVIGVNSAALPQFFAKVWPRVHADVLCVLVSGDSDWGVPGELWAKSQHQEQLPPLRTLLEDSRLIAWFTQNYDFGFGCHHDLARTCHDADDLLQLDGPLLQKLRPLPIGLDFHSLSEKAAEGVIYRGVRATSAEHQQADLDTIGASLPPFIRRPIQAYGSRWRPLSEAAAAASPFCIERDGVSDGGDDDGDGGCPRAQALRVFSSALYGGHIVIETDEVHRSESWRRHGRYAFVISPPGHGMDCHRTWEALALGCIPITLAPTGSPEGWCNPLFKGLPVVVVRRWEEVTEEALHKWRDMHAASFETPRPQAYALANALALQHWHSAAQSGRA